MSPERRSKVYSEAEMQKMWEDLQGQEVEVKTGNVHEEKEDRFAPKKILVRGNVRDGFFCKCYI